MKIGIDIRAAASHKTGKGWYTYHLAKELVAADRKNEYVLYTNAITKDFAAFTRAHIKVIRKHPALWHLAVIKDWRRESGERDLFFAPMSYIIPALLPKKYKSVITVHDIVSFLHPHLHQTKATLLEHLFFNRALRKTRHVLVPSQNTKGDVVRLFHYSEEKITVTPLAPAYAESVVDPRRVKEKYHLPDEFVLTVSGLEPRKNVGMLVDAMSTVVKQFPYCKLVIVGGKGWKSEENQKKVEQRPSYVLWIQNCDADDLSAVYHLAKVFVFPSLYEGFGLPPLEALAAGCPVICSNAASLPEVVSDAALLFDPHDKKMLVSHLENVLKNPEVREMLIQKGKKQVEKFSWKKTAQATLEVFSSLT